MDSEKGRQLHKQANIAMEEGDFLAALKFTDEALAVYVEEGDIFGAAEVLALQVLTFRHLWEKSGKKEFLDLAEVSATKSVRMAEKSGKPEAVAVPLHTLGKVCEDLGQWPEAAEAQQKALDIMTRTPPERHNRPAFLAEIRTHLYADQYRAGDKGALFGLNEAIAALEADSTEPRYNRDVWLSGGYINKAKILKTDDPAEARGALDEARKIIEANPELKLRKEQWEKLAKDFSA